MVYDYQLLIHAGGKGTRLSHITKGKPKCLLNIEGKTLLDYCINCYLSINKVVLLLGYGYDKVIEYVEGEKERGNPLYTSKTIKYSIEKEMLLGKGGAIHLALKNGVINPEKPYIIHYSDDLILEGRFEEKLIAQHEKNVEKGALVTMVIVPKVEYSFGMPVLGENGFVRKFEEKPLIPIPTNVGVYAAEPEVNEHILKRQPPFDWESELLKELCEEGKVGSMIIDEKNWIPVNDEKGLEKAIKRIKQMKLNSL